MKKILGRIGWFLGALIVLGVAWWAGRSLYLFEGFPKGVDSFAHLTRTNWILKNFPQINWNPFWDSGTPFWTWTYPLLTSFLPVALVKFLTLSVAKGMVLGTVIYVMLGVLALYATLRLISRSLWVAVFVCVLVVTTPAFWSWWGHGGNYIRIWGTTFYFWALFFLAWYLKKPTRGRFFWLVLATSLALGSHLLNTGLVVLTFGAWLFWVSPGWKRKIWVPFKVLGTAFLLTAYWYLPMLATAEPGGRFIQRVLAKPVTFKEFFSLIPGAIFFSLPAHFSLILLGGLVLGLGLLFFKRDWEKRERGTVLAFGFLVLGTLAYLLIGNIPGWPGDGYLAVLTPFVTLPVLIYFGAYFLGSVLGEVRRGRAVLVGVLTVLSLGWFLAQLHFDRRAVFDVSQPGNKQVLAQEVLARAVAESGELDRRYRFGTDSAFVADWFNFLYPNHSQTRDYIYQGIPFKDWQYYLEWLVWTQPGRLWETRFLLDWYGIKHLTVGFASPETQFDKFLGQPRVFKKEASSPKEDFYLFSYQEAKPIVTLNNSPAILVVGQEEEYESLFRVLAMAGLSTDHLVPVWGGENLDFSLEELSRFEVLFVYDYPLLKLKKAKVALLEEYLRGGGKILVETNHAFEGTVDLPAFFPMAKAAFEERRGEWDLTPAQKFSPALFGEDPWKVNVGLGLRRGGEVLLRSAGKPVIIRGEFGEGRLIWSGINLAYHALSFENKVEVSYWVELLEELLGEPLVEKEEIMVDFSIWESEKRVMILDKPAKGILVRESHFPQWRAYLKTKNAKGETQNALKIYTAGPRFMYLPLPDEGGSEAGLAYKTGWLEKLGWVVSLVTLVFVLLYSTGRLDKFFARIDLRGWWDKDE
jgi:hypothetical protein